MGRPRRPRIKPYYTPPMVTRSRTRYFGQDGLDPKRRCIVAIEPSLPAIAREWLNQTAPVAQQGQLVQTAQNAQTASNSASALSVSSIQSTPTTQPVYGHQRRASVASCSNIFSVDGSVEELGFDHLTRQRKDQQNQASGSSTISSSSSYIVSATPNDRLDSLDLVAVNAMDIDNAANIADARDEYDALNPANDDVEGVDLDVADNFINERENEENESVASANAEFIPKSDDSDVPVKVKHLNDGINAIDMVVTESVINADVTNFIPSSIIVDTNTLSTSNAQESIQSIQSIALTVPPTAMDVDSTMNVNASNIFDAQNPSNPNHLASLDSANRGNVDNVNEGAQSPIIRWGSQGRSVAFDPFKRTRNLPFSMGRRRSVDVFATIDEAE